MSRLESREQRLTFRDQLMRWAKTHLREFFWREGTLSPYEFLVIEVLLARTRARSAEPVARSFLDRYPDVQSLSQAHRDELEAILRPLGLFRKRAKAFSRMSELLIERHDGDVPNDEIALLDLPYVGRYSANAVRCFAFGESCGVVDANVARVLSRFFDLQSPRGKIANANEYWDLANRLVSEESPRRYNWALLDLGALVCKPGTPECNSCLLSSRCRTGLTHLDEF